MAKAEISVTWQVGEDEGRVDAAAADALPQQTRAEPARRSGRYRRLALSLLLLALLVCAGLLRVRHPRLQQEHETRIGVQQAAHLEAWAGSSWSRRPSVSLQGSSRRIGSALWRGDR